MSSWLVTGSEGFLGRHFCEQLQEAGEQVHGWDIKDPVRGIRDMRDLAPRSLFAYPVSQYDYAVHCAALVDGRESIEGKAAELLAYNVQLDGLFFQWALRAKPKRVLYISSSAVYSCFYQEHGDERLKENLHDRCTDPDQTYGYAKQVGERLAGEVRKAGVPVTVVRPFSGYGVDQDDRYPFPAIMQRARERRDPFEVWGDGEQVRDFIHVDDIVRGALTMMRSGVDGPVNLGTGRGTSMRELAELAMACVGHGAEIRVLTDKPTGVRYRVADTSTMSEHYTPQVDLPKGVVWALGDGEQP